MKKLKLLVAEAEKKKANSKVQELTPQQMRQSAKALRSNPGMARKQNPQLAGFSDQQILEMADQYEKMAENHDMVKKMKEMMESTTEDERQELMKFQEEMKASGAFENQTPGAAPSENQIEILTKMLKKNPESFKKIMKSSGMFPGVSEDQLNTSIDQLQQMDPNTVKMILSSTKYLQPLKEYYEKFDQMTYGCAKYILGVIAIIALYYIAIFVWWLLKLVWWALSSLLAMIIGGGGQKVAAGVADLPKAGPAASSVAGDAAKGGDEFEF